jgi:hypothetical protein
LILAFVLPRIISAAAAAAAMLIKTMAKEARPRPLVVVPQ